MSEAQMHQPLLEVKGLKEYFDINMGFFRTKPLKAVDDVSFTINKGETLGLVGESGCGKTTVGRTILQLYKPTAGEIIYDGKPVKTKADLQKFRTKATMVFQDANEAWATDPSTYIGNGPYTMTAWEHNSKITLTKNPYYHAVDKVTMDELDFYLSDDANNMLANFQKGDWQLIDDVPTSEIASLKEQYPTEFVIAGQIGTYYVCWNINEEILPADVLANMTPEEAEAARAEIRQAIGLLFDRNYIVEEIGQAGQVPASSFVPMGMTDADGSEFYKNAGHVEGITGYYDVTDDEDVYMANFDKAVETLKKYYTYDEENGVFTNFPSLTYLYNTSEAHKAIGEYLQSAVSAVGITMNLTNQEWNTFLNTRKSGDYSIARNGWIADYNDPICFLDMWVTGSGNNDVQFGKGANADLKIYNLDLTPYGYDVKVENGTWAETYDVLISAIKSCTDSANRYAMMHVAEDMLMDTGCIVPLYYYTDIYMLDDSVQGFFSNPLGYKYFMHCTIAK